MLALASRRQRATASPTESGTWLPPGASRNAKPLCNELKRRRTAVGSSVSAAIGVLRVRRASGRSVPPAARDCSCLPRVSWRWGLLRVEALDQHGARLPQLRELTLGDQLSQHLHRCSLRSRGVLAEVARDGGVVAEAPDPDALVPVGERLGGLVELLELPAALVQLDELEPGRLDEAVEGPAGAPCRGGDGAKARRVKAAAVGEHDAYLLGLPGRHLREHLERARHVVEREDRAAQQAYRGRDLAALHQPGGLRDLGARELQPQLGGLVDGREQQFVAVSPVLRRLLQRQQLVGAQIALVVARAGAAEQRGRVILVGFGRVAHVGVSPSRMRASVAKSRLPPETTATILPEPARPASEAAMAGAPAPSAIPRTRSASRRTAAAVSSSVATSASSINGATCGHISASTLRLPAPS